MSPHSPDPAERPPHPLAVSLIERLRGRDGLSVLEIGAGSGRNTRALSAAGLYVFGGLNGPVADAAIATHALLHGTPATIGELLERIASGLRARAPLYATFGSTRDARYRTGEEIEPRVYAPLDGDERGVAHTFFDEVRLRALIDRHFHIESLAEVSVDDIAGTWAHQERPLEGAVHWFLVATKR
jgi:hypothetical protein